MLYLRKQILLILLWSALWNVSLLAQYNLTKIYTVKDGLPMTEISKCLISREGRLFFTTTTGRRLSYDGFVFKEFSKNQIIRKPSDNELIIEDIFGVWIVSGGSVYRYWQNEEISIETPLAKTCYYDESIDRLVLVTNHDEALLFNPESNRFELDTLLTARRKAYGKPRFYSRISKFGSSWEIVGYQGRRGVKVYAYNGEKSEKGASIYENEIYSFFPIGVQKHIGFLFPDLNQSVSFPHLFDGKAWKPIKGLDWGGRERHFPNYQFFQSRGRMFMSGKPPPEAALSDKDVEVWEIDSLGRAYLYARFQISAATADLKLQMDAAGNFWLPAHSGLVKVFPAFLGCFETHPNMNGGLHVISEDAQGQIWFGFYRHGFAVFDGDRIKAAPAKAAQFRHIMPGSWRDDQGFMYFFKENDYGFFKTNGPNWKFYHTRTIHNKNRFTGYFFHPLSNQKLAMGLFDNLGIGLMNAPYEPGNPVQYINKEKGMLLKNVLTLAEDHNQRIWFGRASQGVGVYDPRLDTAVTWLIENQKGIGALSSLIDSKGYLWLGTGQGLAFLENPHKFNFLKYNVNDSIQTLSRLEAGDGLVTFMKEYKGYLCFGNNIGFGLLDLDSFYRNHLQPRVHFFNTINYLSGGASEQNAVIVDRNQNIWMGNDQGAIRLNLDRLRLDTSRIYFDSLWFFHGANDQSKLKGKTLKLPRGRRNLSFKWHSRFDKQLRPNRWLAYQLILSGKDTLKSDNYVVNDKVALGYIPPGKHRLILTLYKNNKIAEEKNIQLIIPKNLEDVWWFWASISGFLLLAGASILWLVYQNKRQQQRFELETEKLKREKEAFQIQAVTSSLNPHFLNNTLHWVQAKVRKDAVARLIIGNLAENIRIVFRLSRNKAAFHSLLDEMKLVENYLTIQTKRFGDRYQFILPSEEELLRYRHIMVPLMQIQIHAENAVEWGLRNRKESTYLSIALEYENQYLKITVEDDGLGYSNAIRMKKSGTRQGTKMLKDLQKLFNAYNEEKIISRLEDGIYFNARNGSSYGTRIIILIPKRYNYEIAADKSGGRRRRT